MSADSFSRCIASFFAGLKFSSTWLGGPLGVALGSGAFDGSVWMPVLGWALLASCSAEASAWLSVTDCGSVESRFGLGVLLIADVIAPTTPPAAAPIAARRMSVTATAVLMAAT